VLFGDGPLRAISSGASQARLQSRFVMPGFRDDLRRFLPNLDVGASLITEGLPVFLLESCAAQVPMVATSVAAFRSHRRRATAASSPRAMRSAGGSHREFIDNGLIGRPWPDGVRTVRTSSRLRRWSSLLRTLQEARKVTMPQRTATLLNR